jgi:ribokinase
VVDWPKGTDLIVVDADGENQIAAAPGANDEVTVAPAVCEAAAVLRQLELLLDTITAVVERATGFVALNDSPARPLPAKVIGRCDLIVVNQSEYAAMPAPGPSRPRWR